MKRNNRFRRFARFFRAKEAVSALEYAILVGVIAVGIGSALVAFRGQIEVAITEIGNKVGALPGSLMP